MRRIIAQLSIAAVAVALLAGCSTAFGSSDLKPIDLSDSSVVSALCGDDAQSVADFVASAADAKPSSGKRNALKDWGIDNPKDDKALAELQTTLDERAKVDCEDSDASDNSDDPAGTLTAVETSITLDEDLWGDLDWDYPDAYADLVTKYEEGMKTKDGVTYPVFVIGSNLPDKVWTDSIRPRLATKSIKEVFAHILAEPDYGWQVCSGLAHSSITGGKSLLELNPWLAECYDPAGINDWAQAAMDGTPAEKLIVAKKLALVVMLLEQLHNESVGQESTAFNYHLVVGEAGGVMAIDPKNPDAISEFELSPVQYVGEFVTIEITFKGQTGCWLRVGFNTGDGRFAGFACETPTPPSGNCAELGNCPPTHTPGCEETGTCPSCPTPQDCPTPKNPADDVEHPQGWTPLGPDPVQTTAPAPKPAPLDPGTPVTADPLPAPAPAPVVTQAPAPVDPGTPIVDPDKK